MVPTRFWLITTLLVSSVPLFSGDSASAANKVGILVMAHGGDADWNGAVEEAVNPLRDHCPVVTAFGMAQRDSLQEAVNRLEEQGVRKIAVVRLFVSGQSFLPQTEYLLGINPAPPSQFLHHPGAGGQHPVHILAGGSAPPPIQTQSMLAISRDGLYDSPAIGTIIVERTLSLSRTPELESVLILAHGEGDEAVNEKWLSKLDQLAQEVRRVQPFRQVRAETLREDWRDQRKLAEKRIREFVLRGSLQGGRVIVVPFRVYGFGPYAQILEGLHYVSDGRALLPHPAVTDWIEEQAEACFSTMGAANPFDSRGVRD